MSDDGVGLPDDYDERGHGFENMRANVGRLGGRLIVEPRGSVGGASETCVMPLSREEQEGWLSTESRPIRVLLADDHAVTREGLQLVLEWSEEFEVVGQARESVEEATAASELSPDVIVMDVMMPKKDGVQACREIMETLPDTRVIMLTASTEADAVIETEAAVRPATCRSCPTWTGS